MALEKACEVVASEQGKELVQHGSAMFPVACYEENMTCYSVPWHWHEDLEYILAHEGAVTVGVDGRHYTLAQGQGILINSEVLHAVEYTEKAPSVLHSAVFHPRLVGGVDTVYWQKFVQPLLTPGAPPCFLLDESIPWQGAVLEHLRASWQAIAAEDEDYENLGRYHLSAAMHAIADHCPVYSAKTSQQQQVEAQRVKQMLHFIEQHYSEELTLREIAESASLSESACLRSFRKLLGTTPIQYVRQYRIEKAAELLISTQLKMGEVGAECGFADVSYFTKSFREQKNCTPREYRQRFLEQTRPKSGITGHGEA